MDKIDTNNILKTFTFKQEEPLYALVSNKNEVWKVGNILEMLVENRKYNTSLLKTLEEHKPFNVIKIDNEKSFIKEANH